MKLWEHQELAVNKALSACKFGVFHEVGTGKTLTALTILRETWNRNNRKPLRSLWITRASLTQATLREIDKVAPRITPYALEIASNMKLTERFDAIRSCSHALFITNFNSFDHKPFWDVVRSWQPQVIIIDEAHTIRNPSSKRAKRIVATTFSSQYVILLTGTPLLGGVMDSYNYLRMLGLLPEKQTLTDWRNRHFVYLANQFKYEPLPGTDRVLMGQLATKASWVKSQDVVELPPLIERTETCELPLGLRKLYSTLAKEFVASLGEGEVVVTDTIVTNLLRLRQICSGIVVTDKGEKLETIKKIETLREILTSYRHDQIIIWSCFVPTYLCLSKMLNDEGLTHGFCHGRMSPVERARHIEEFQSGKRQVLIANASSGGAGLNLQNARVAIYYSQGYSLEERSQSEARNYRAGSSMHKTVERIDIVTRDTVEEKILQAVRQKKTLIELLESMI